MPDGYGAASFSGAVDLSYMLAANAAGEAQGSPRWWLSRLSAELEARRFRLTEEDNYYEGEHPLFFATPKFREAFGTLFEEFADNWCEVVVDASAERLEVEGFRFGKDAQQADSDAWELWQRNGLDAESGVAHTEAVKHGTAYVIVEPTPDGPLITVEHPSQVIVATDPANRRRRIAAMKKWMDEYGYVYATVYLPDAAYRYVTAKPAVSVSAAGSEWVERDGYSIVGLGPLKGEVPVVPILNSPSLLRGGRSDLRKVIPLQNAINKLATDAVVASEFTAFRQRLLTGVEVPRYPEGHPQEGEPMNEAFLASVTRLMVVEEPDAKVQEFQASDLNNYVQVIEMFVQHLAAQSRTPPHYLMGQVVNASGDALKAAETGLVRKVKGKQKFMGQGWEDVMRLAFKAKGDAVRAKESMVETVWTDAENRSEAEVADAAIKGQTLGVPDEISWERLGYKQFQIERMKKMRDEELAKMAQLALGGTRPLDANGNPAAPAPVKGNPAAGGPAAATAGAPKPGAPK